MTTKFADLMREGSKLYPKQIFGDWINLEEGAACALGAVVGAYYKGTNPDEWADDPERMVDEIMEELGFSWWVEIKCPVCHSERGIEFIIIHLNDEHKWTREQIADWFDTADIAVNPEREVAHDPR